MSIFPGIRWTLGVLALTSLALVVSASDAVAQEQAPGEALFVMASVDNDRPYFGQQVAYIFRIFRRSDLPLPSGQVRYEPPGFAGFWNSEVSERREYVETVGGKEYTVVELRALLFPNSAGTVEIGPAGLTSPLGTLNSEPVVLDVRQLPEGAPPGFTGAVGRFEIAIELKTGEIEINEPLQAMVIVSGEGNFDALPDPVWPEFDNWRLIEAPSDADSQVVEGRLTGVRVYDVALAPEKDGRLTIPSIVYQYFAPGLDRYASAATDPIIVSVVDTGGPSTAPADADIGEEDRSGQEPRPIMTSPSSMSRAGGELTDLPVYWAAWLMPALFIVGAVLWRRRQNALETARTESRQRNALANARNTLSRAADGGDVPTAVAANALLSYLSDRLGEYMTGLTSDGGGLRMQSASVPHDLADRAVNLISRGEEARFAPGEEYGVGTSSNVERTIQILNDLDEAIEV